MIWTAIIHTLIAFGALYVVIVADSLSARAQGYALLLLAIAHSVPWEGPMPEYAVGVLLLACTIWRLVDVKRRRNTAADGR
jgi:hypothetical protein